MADTATLPAETQDTKTEGKTGEYRGLNSEKIGHLRRQKDALEASVDFLRNPWDKFRRFNDLYYGVIPPELDGTYSKINYQVAYAIVQNEVPRSASSILSSENFFRLTAQALELEGRAESATKWLNYQVRNRNKIMPRLIPTLTRASICGTGFRVVTYRPVDEYRTKRVGRRMVRRRVVNHSIVSQNVSEFNILPAPTGTVINTLDPDSYEALPFIHWLNYKTRNTLEKMKGLDKDQLGKLFAEFPRNGNRAAAGDGADMGQSEEYMEAQLSKLGLGTPGYIQDIRSGKYSHLDAEYRCFWTFFRDRWMLVAENRYLLYDGPPHLDWFPIAGYTPSPDPDSIFGRGLIEIAEDAILAILLNRNMRQDWLAHSMNPTRYYRQDIVEVNGGNLAAIDSGPNGAVMFPRHIQDIHRAMYIDRLGDVPPQAFMEDTGLQQYLQEVLGQPNYMKGMGGSSTLANETATGILSLIEEGTARSSMRSLMAEHTGLQDELMLYLMYGDRYVDAEQQLPIPLEDGWPWSYTDPDVITSAYDIELQGTKGIVSKNKMVQNMVSILPLLLQNPNVPGQREVLKQVLTEMGAWKSVEKILGPEGGTGPTQLGMGTPGALAAGTPTAQNEAQAIAGAPEQAAMQAGGGAAMPLPA